MKINRTLVDYSMRYSRALFLLVLLLVAAAGWQLQQIQVDTDPENMLPHDQVDRLYHEQVKARFNLHDMLVVGIVNLQRPEGVYNPVTLDNLYQLSNAIAGMKGVVRQDLMSLSTVDNISQVADQPGTIRFQWMMDQVPSSLAQADQVRRSVQRLPLLQNTLVSEDNRAAGIYIPIEAKSESYRLASEIQHVMDRLSASRPDSGDQFYMAGLPVAEDTFGVEMFIQMAISAPLAGLMIFVLMWLFFRSLLLIIAPMLVAMASVILTMGLLIGQGYTVHIMSSMIPIFLMPIAVVDSVHILSEFADHYKPGESPKHALREVFSQLFTPMFYTSVTSAVGFASLAFTPIPPVQIFGLHVAVGIMLAFLLTVTLVPAFIVSLTPARLAALKDHRREQSGNSLLSRWLQVCGRFATGRARLLVIGFLAVCGLSAYGVSTIQINDNPVRWFKQDHRLRVADQVMNDHFSGTYEAYLVLEAPPADQLRRELDRLLLSTAETAGKGVTNRLQALQAAEPDASYSEYLNRLVYTLDELSFSDPDNEALWLALLTRVEQAQSDAKYFLSPRALMYLEQLQNYLNSVPQVGKSNSLVTLLKTVYRELQGGSQQDYRLPESRAAAAQTILSFQSSHRPDDLWHMVTPDYRATLLWLQLSSGDNQAMNDVVRLVDDYIAAHPLPQGVTHHWAGLTYINVVWQEKMVKGMLNSLLSAFVMVLIIMVLLFRSVKMGLLAMLPLSVTILFIYGLIGFVGKDYDMPIAVLSALTLGLSVDFAIHFLERCRAIYRQTGNWPDTVDAVFGGPARAISRNAIVIAIGFTPLLFAPLVPYITVGFFLATIMAVSAVVTIILLPAVIHLLAGKSRLFAPGKENQHV